MAELIPLALKDAPALIESVFPAQKVSFEAQKERKANLGQTLTGLGSYWKGRKPLILVRAIVLGSLLPQTDDAEKDLEIFEKLPRTRLHIQRFRLDVLVPPVWRRVVPDGDARRVQMG